jgi:hypothetical protein
MISSDIALLNSIAVVAHPDDEVLWFSSILDKLDEVLICFLEWKEKPYWTASRQKALSEYPIKNISCLSIDESGVFNNSNFHNPVPTQYGLKVLDKNTAERNYIGNYYKLAQLLQKKLKNYQNVFTHNPWGEYGNEEHIQVYRVIRNLQEKMGFNLWFSNYCSNKSIKLMSQYIDAIDERYFRLHTNRSLAGSIKDLYKRNDCWSWYDDWEWFNEESFFTHRDSKDAVKKGGQRFPLNFIRVMFPAQPKKKSSFLTRLKSIGKGSKNKIR